MITVITAPATATTLSTDVTSVYELVNWSVTSITVLISLYLLYQTAVSIHDGRYLDGFKLSAVSIAVAITPYIAQIFFY